MPKAHLFTLVSVLVLVAASLAVPAAVNAGTPTGSRFLIHNDATPSEVQPAGDFLVAWQDQPVGATNTNIYGHFWGNRVYLPLVLR